MNTIFQRLKKSICQSSEKQITIRIDEPTIIYFKQLAEESGIPYQSLINLYLRDCALSNRKLEIAWQ